MSSLTNDIIQERVWQEIQDLDESLNEKFLELVSDTARETGLHEDDDRGEILLIIAEDMYRKYKQ